MSLKKAAEWLTTVLLPVWDTDFRQLLVLVSVAAEELLYVLRVTAVL